MQWAERVGEGGAGHPAYPDALGTAHVVGRQGALGGQHALLMMALQVPPTSSDTELPTTLCLHDAGLI